MNSNFDFTIEPGTTLNVPNYVNHKPVISIITSTFNPSELFIQTVNSVLNQTYPYFEWLIINDGSTNKKSITLLKEIEELDNRIKVITIDNVGPSSARDFGVKHSCSDSKYIMFIDDDDLIINTFLETAYFSLVTHKDATWSYCDVVNFDAANSLWAKKFSTSKMKKNNLLVNCAVIKKEAFNSVGGFNINGKSLYEDWILWLKFLAKGYYPVHMSYFGFWYRKKNNAGEFNSANNNRKKNLSIIKKYANKVTANVQAVEYPKADYSDDTIDEYASDYQNYKLKDNKKINILYIVPWMVLGGADKFNLDLINLLDKNKYSVTLLVTQPTEYVWRQKFESVCDAVYDLSAFADQKDWLKFVNILIESRNIDLIFNTNSTCGYSMLPYIKKKYPNIKIMDYIHMEEWYNRNGGYSRDSAEVHYAIDKTLFCNKNSERILNEYFEVPKDETGTVYIGVDTNKFNPDNYSSSDLRNKYGINQDAFVCSFIARIDLQKRPFLLMNIIENTINKNAIENLLFLVVGDGPLLSNIKKNSKSKKLEKYIKFIGKSSCPEEIYAISDVTLNCSIKEGLALTSYESLSMGVPVVSSDVGGQRELITNDVGKIVPCLQEETDIHNYNYSREEIDNYVEAIIDIYNNIDKYRQNCRKHILEGFTIDQMVKNMETEISNVLNNKSKKMISEDIQTLLELQEQYFNESNDVYQWCVDEYNRKMFGLNSDGKLGFKTKLNETKYNIRETLWRIPAWKKTIMFIKRKKK